MKKVNVERKAKRQKRYKAYLASAAWKKLRLAVFERDGFRCTATVPEPRGVQSGDGPFFATGGYYPVRCRNADETRKGKGLVCDHKTYSRFGHELMSDLRTLCRDCDRRETKAHRANWMQGSRSGFSSEGSAE